MLTPHAVPREMRPLIAPYRDRARKIALAVSESGGAAQPRSYVFEITRSRELNAIAFSYKDVDGIACHYGLWFTLLAVSHALFGLPGFFAHVGEPNRDAAARSEHRKRLKFLAAVAPAGTLAREFPVPAPSRCRYRYRAAYALAELALDFVFFHELAHIHAGHLDFIAASADERSLVELGAAPAHMTLGDRRALEVDADMWSCSMFTVLQDSEIWGDLDRREIFQSVSDYLVAWFTGITIVFRLFEMATPHMSSSRASHPHPAIRQWFASAGLEADASNDGSLDIGLIDPAMTRALYEVDAVWREARLTSTRPYAGVDEEWEQTRAEYLNLLGRLTPRPKRWALSR